MSAPSAGTVPEKPLRGIRVLDVTQALAGPFAGMTLADLGADVIKIERPTGDFTRSTPPYYVADTSLYFLSINRGKSSLILDLKTEAGRSVFYRLVERSDVVLTNFSAGVVERLAIDHATLSRINPAIVSCNITGFGVHGPESDRRAVDLIVQAVAGPMSITGEPGRAPVKAGVPTADLAAALYAVIGVLAALAERASTGVGRRVDTDLYHAQVALLGYLPAFALHSQSPPQALGSAHMGTVPSQAFETADGHIVVDAGKNNHFQALCRALQIPEMASDERYAERQARHENRAELIGLLSRKLSQYTTSQLADLFREHGVPFAHINNLVEVMASEQNEAYGMVVEADFQGERFATIRTPVWFDDQIDRRATFAASFGADIRRIMSEVLDLDDREVDELARGGAFGQLKDRDSMGPADTPGERVR